MTFFVWGVVAFSIRPWPNCYFAFPYIACMLLYWLLLQKYKEETQDHQNTLPICLLVLSRSSGALHMHHIHISAGYFF